MPRSEPLADDERIRGLPGTARLLPSDLATGVRVRRRGEAATERAVGAGAAARGGTGTAAQAGAAGTAGGAGVGDARPASAPTVLRAPETVMALVTSALHTAAPSATRSRPAPAQRAAVVLVAAPTLGPAVAPSPPPGVDLRATAKRLLGTCVEVLGGFRPIAQLRPYCAPERFDAIANRLLRPIGAGRGHGATRSSLIAGRVAPGRPSHGARVSPEERIIIRRVQVCDVMEGIAELAVVMARHNKVWAMTMRMERSRGRWLCMHLEVV